MTVLERTGARRTGRVGWRGGFLAIVSVAMLAAAVLVASVEARAQESGEGAEFVFTGVVEPRHSVRLANRVSGVVEEVLISGGERVAEGDLLFILDRAPFEIAVEVARAAVAEAEARMKLAEDVAERQAALGARGAGSEARATQAAFEVEIEKANLAQRRAELRRAELDLARTEIRAPIGGVVERPAVSPGAFVEAEAGTTLGVIVSLDPVLVSYRVPHAARLTAFAAAGVSSSAELFDSIVVSLILPNGEPYPHAGRALFDSVTADQDTGDLATWAEFPNPNGVLAAGLRVEVRSRVVKGERP